MKWLIELVTDSDPISACRLMNVFRRKGLNLEALVMAPKLAGFGLIAVVEFAESELGHIFSYLRRTEGVLGVNCYRQGGPAEASFIWVSADSDKADVAQALVAFAEAKLIFASQGKCLREVPRAFQGLNVCSSLA
jgi:hypothetical protein